MVVGQDGRLLRCRFHLETTAVGPEEGESQGDLLGRTADVWVGGWQISSRRSAASGRLTC